MLTAEQVANYFLRLVDEESGDSISNLKLQKLVYYAQAWHLAVHGRPLFNDPLQAWAHGPVVPGLYQRYRDYGWQPLPRPTTPVLDIDSETQAVLDDVWEAYGPYTAKRLETMTHEEAPWQKARARQGCAPGDFCNDPIRHEEMQLFYSHQSDLMRGRIPTNDPAVSFEDLFAKAFPTDEPGPSPWYSSLRQEDQKKMEHDIKEAVGYGMKSGDWSHVEEVDERWRATARIAADPILSALLLEPLTPAEEVVARRP